MSWGFLFVNRFLMCYDREKGKGILEMTELETLVRAKTYMENLANGINPLNDVVISEHEVVNNVQAVL